MKPVCVHLSPLWHPLEIPSTESWVYLACWMPRDRKSTRLNSSHLVISYAVFCLKKKTKTRDLRSMRTKSRNTGSPASTTYAMSRNASQPVPKLYMCADDGPQKSTIDRCINRIHP